MARREFVERARDRSFVISTAITVIVLIGLIVANALFNKGTRFQLGVVGTASRALGASVALLAESEGVHVTLREYASEAAAESKLRSGGVDAVLLRGSSIVVKSSPPADLIRLLESTAQTRRVRSTVVRLGLTPPEATRLLSPSPLPVRALVAPNPHQQSNTTVAFVGVILLYGQLFGYGVAVASGVVEEKSSRVVELLLSTIRPSQLLMGKILGIGALGLLQLLFVGAVGFAAALAVGRLAFPAGALGTAAIVLLWFVLGFAFFSTLFAVAGAVVPRQEELQNAVLPLSLLILVSFFVSIGAVGNPGSSVAAVASFLPPSAPLAMPLRFAQGAAPVWQVLVSAAISVASTAALIPVAARLYSGAILRTGGRVKLREAWRSEAD